ncbi:MAG: hypothetical protein ACD_64C00224G0004 [uncultured bacterium]|nr:MAG: hypothetical protein ACD_64C00224G0004 [uncultured bacterium]
MKKLIFSAFLITTSLSAHEIPDRFLGQSVSAIWTTIHANITSFFEPKEHQVSPPPPETLEQPTVLSPFQKLFRQTISFTHNSANVLTNLASQIINEAKEKMYTTEQATDRFIQHIEHAGRSFMKTMLYQTLNVDLNRMMPSLKIIKTYMHRLQNTVPHLEQAELMPQIQELISYLEQTRETAAALQKIGVAKVSAKLAAHSFSSKEHPVVTQFKKLYATYPSLITRINNLKIPAAGAIAHNAFNTSSELIEQIIFLHDSTGKIGPVLIDDALIKPLDSLKNQVRKLGNAAEFATSTRPVIVVAPPTTSAALMEILATYIWRSGFSLQEIAQEKIRQLTSLISPIKQQVTLLKHRISNFKHMLASFQHRLHAQFVAQLKENSLVNIPLAPQLLLNLLEKEVELLKSQLIIMMHASLALTYRISHGIGLSSSLLECMNQYMGATDEQPFIHRDIIRGVQFVAQDTAGFTNIIINVVEALKEYNPIPFRDGLEDIELL